MKFSILVTGLLSVSLPLATASLAGKGPCTDQYYFSHLSLIWSCRVNRRTGQILIWALETTATAQEIVSYLAHFYLLT